MNKKQLDVLEKVFECEINGLKYQNKNKVAKQLEADGYLVLRKSSETVGSLRCDFEWYELTIAGHHTYCLSERCAGDIE